MHYFPLEWPFLLGLFLLLSVIVVLLELRILHYAYERMGISPRSAIIPPIVALLCALVLSWRQAGPLAYIGGSMGTLIGADIMNLDKIQGLGAPVASIGGAGTFDGVFLVGIVAVLLASLIQPRQRRAS